MDRDDDAGGGGAPKPQRKTSMEVMPAKEPVKELTFWPLGTPSSKRIANFLNGADDRAAM
jgi:hypothetical protein